MSSRAIRTMRAFRRYLQTAVLAAPIVACGREPERVVTTEPRSVAPAEPVVTTESAPNVAPKPKPPPPKQPSVPRDGLKPKRGEVVCIDAFVWKHETSDGTNCRNAIEVDDVYGTLDVKLTLSQRAAGDPDDCCYEWSTAVKGRALLVDGAPIGASVRRGPARGPARSRRAADHWLRAAISEHASIASFARARRELVAARAPRELVDDCRRAGRDEARHATACFAIASRHANRCLTPGRLPGLAARGGGAHRVALDTFVEAAVPETIAVVQAMTERHAARDRDEQRALDMIIADEQRHSALAWRTVAWAVAAGGLETRDELLRLAERVRHDSQPAAPRVWREIIDPLIASVTA